MVSGITRRQHSVLPVDSLVKYTDSEGTEPGLSYMISFTHFRSVAPSRIWSGDEPLATLSRKKSFMNFTISAPVEYMPPEVTQHKERQQRSNKDNIMVAVYIQALEDKVPAGLLQPRSYRSAGLPLE